ncbi:type I restriction modification DNA specificity domain protein [Burkholderia pseudomallei MSHR983]|uniref:restriction endonuclease subunit S n=1 Tax=Burkholderia pseudomallei TaxID=28450 RepID=UPI000537F922|nr:restriction endonuclease subunit S [Burkholderia pseudomallei]KGU63698.1 type I restriction modification DNA specificity domain protein [Burkholderia pseudomallei MSHR983]
MSNKYSSAMNEGSNQKKAMVPRLRFPEFRRAEAWELKPLGQIAHILNEKAGNKKLTLLSITSGVGLVSQIEKFGREIAGSQYKNYYVIRRDDFAYNKSSTKDYPEGFIARYQSGEDGAVPNSIFTCFRVRAGASHPPYLSYLFENNLHGKWLRRFITIGARAHGSLNVDDTDLLATPVPVPPKEKLLDEQKKIADCLFSLDELIKAETQKLDSLRIHKKGLMQQLFPREGEAVPRLRFPEFRDAEKWGVKTLSAIAENLDNRRIPVTESNRIKGAIPYYGASGVVDYIHDFIFDEDLLCVSEDGANLVARTTPIAFSISGKTWVNNHAHVLKFERRCVQKIVEDYLNLISLEDYLTGMAQPKLNRSMLDTIPVPIPVDESEQQAVADCLSSVDDLIAAQRQKIDGLKTHKKGLMRQLFPVLNEVQE